MLYITRRRNEAIIIDNDIRITVVEVQSNKVKIGIESSSGHQILREELYVRLTGENEEASNSTLA